MIRLSKKKGCCGCSACASVCPKSSISMKRDEEGFLYPYVDKNTCIDCHLCEKVCPFINVEKAPKRHSKVFAAISKNKEVRLNSSSGGVFSEFAKTVIGKGGCVYGASFTDGWNVSHICVEHESDISLLCRSKYVQSIIDNTYKEAKKQLLKGRLVLFSGTSCQIAGLKHFLRKDYGNLITIEILCHGVPSPKVWNLYLKKFLEPHNYNISDIAAISFRDKVQGMTEYEVSVCMKDGKRICHFFYEDAYMNGFLSNLTLRPSCYSCKVKGGGSDSDIVLGDLWNNYQQEPYNDCQGTNVVLVNTEKGMNLLNMCNLMAADIGDKGINYNKNSGFQKKQFVNPYRKEFFRVLNEENVIELLKRYSEIPLGWRMLRRIKRILKI